MATKPTVVVPPPFTRCYANVLQVILFPLKRNPARAVATLFSKGRELSKKKFTVVPIHLGTLSRAEVDRLELGQNFAQNPISFPAEVGKNNKQNKVSDKILAVDEFMFDSLVRMLEKELPSQMFIGVATFSFKQDIHREDCNEFTVIATINGIKSDVVPVS